MAEDACDKPASNQKCKAILWCVQPHVKLTNKLPTSIFFQDCLHTKDKVKEAGINNFSKTENPPMRLIERKCIKQGFLMNILNFTLETGQVNIQKIMWLKESSILV